VIAGICKRFFKTNLAEEWGTTQLVEPMFWISKLMSLPIVTVSDPVYVDFIERLVMSGVRWCEVPLSRYHKGSWRMEGVSRIEGSSSSSTTEETRYAKLALI